jgi:RNA polymerase sigma factor (sigma-70 family)
MLAVLNRVFQTHRRSLIWSVRRIVGDAQIAEDLTQETYIRVRRAAETGPIEHLEAFLHQTARNLALDHQRRRRVRSVVEVDAGDEDALRNVADSIPSQEAAFIEREKFRVLRKALQKLPPRAQQVVILSRIEEWSNRRIAEHLGISERTVFNDLKMAMAHCRDSLVGLDPR